MLNYVLKNFQNEKNNGISYENYEKTNEKHNKLVRRAVRRLENTNNNNAFNNSTVNSNNNNNSHNTVNNPNFLFPIQQNHISISVTDLEM